jgi:hypothetical protein
MHPFHFISRYPQRQSIVLLAIVSIALGGGCSRNVTVTPSVQLTRVPTGDPGGPLQMDYIEGRASEAGPGQKIVLYARSGVWWIQPFKAHPFSNILPDSSWKNSTHLGTEYAALLVEPGYHPASKIDALPSVGNGVVAVVRAKGPTAKPFTPKLLHFSGYDWTVRTAGSDRGGEPNFYDPENAWVDEKGYLHLRMDLRNGRWSCVEVVLNRSLGYGSYRFVIQDSSHLGSSPVVGMYTLDDAAPDDTRNELDIELSRWATPNRLNAQYVVQPYYVPENVARFTVPAGEVTHIFRWEPGIASFRSIRGSANTPEAKSISEHVFNSGVPTPAAEKVHIDLYEFHHSRSTLQRPAEVVIEKFEYLP